MIDLKTCRCLAGAALLGLGLAAPSPSAPSGPLTPCYGKFFLAAGSGEEGHKDGYFLDADFNQPAGLALSQDNHTLYVADAGNHDLRAVALDDQDRVSTLLGDGESGRVDGVGAAARLSWPTQVVAEADGSAVWLLDQENQALRRADLKTLALQTVEYAPDGPPFTCVSADPKGGVYLVLGDRLLHRDAGATADVPVTRDPALDCPDGRLVAAGGTLIFCSPCSGRFCAMNARKEFVPEGPACLTATADAFCPVLDQGQWKILFWSPDTASIRRFNPADQSLDTLPMRDYQGTLLPGPSPDLFGINGSSDFRPLLKKKLRMVAASDGSYYCSEACSDRIIGVDGQLLLPRDADANKVRQDAPGKPPHSVRLDVVGGSLTWYWPQAGPEKYYVQDLAFIRELERNLNLESALHGQGLRYQVQAQVSPPGLRVSPPSYFLQKGGRIKGQQVDQVLLCLDPDSLGREPSPPSLREDLAADVELAQRYGAKVSVAILPGRAILETGEGGGSKQGLDPAAMDQPVWDLCQELGIPCYDAVEPMRVVALGAYPLFIPADGHYMPRGHGWLASMLARVMTGTIANLPPNRSQP